MSTYNVLDTEITCVNCRFKTSILLQFKFGDTWQLRYHINDKIQWGGNDIGRPNLRLVKVYGIAEQKACPFCNEQYLEEYDILVNNDCIMGINLMGSYEDYSSSNEGDYFILEE